MTTTAQDPAGPFNRLKAWATGQPRGRLANVGTVCSIATCYSKLLTTALASAGAVTAAGLNPHLQAAVMTLFAVIAVYGLYLDRAEHQSNTPLVLGAIGAAIVIGTLYISYAEEIEFTGYFFLVVAVFLNQNRHLRHLNRAVAGMNEQLAQRAREAELATVAKSQFLANMSHELRTPLNAIIGLSEMLHEEAVEDGQQDNAEAQGRVVRASRHLQSLIDDILDLSKIEAGKIEVHREPVQLGEFLSDLDLTTRQLADRNNNELRIAGQDDTRTVNVDPIRLRQILLNLIGNACKFTEEGKVKVQPEIQGPDGREHLVVTVSDTGAGIAPEELAVVFEEFGQAGHESQRDRGHGLGLAISRRLSLYMGGEIEAESQLGHGSTFTLRLPVHTAA